MVEFTRPVDFDCRHATLALQIITRPGRPSIEYKIARRRHSPSFLPKAPARYGAQYRRLSSLFFLLSGQSFAVRPVMANRRRLKSWIATTNTACTPTPMIIGALVKTPTTPYYYQLAGRWWRTCWPKVERFRFARQPAAIHAADGL